MKIRTRVLSLVFCLVLVVSFSVPVSAVGAALSAAEIFGAMWSVYASSVGLSQSFKTEGRLNSISNPYSNQSYSNAMSGLFDQYQASIGGSQTIAEWASWALDRMSVGSAPSTGTVFRMTSDLVEFFDAYGTYILEDVLGVTRNAVTGLFDRGKTWFNNTISNVAVTSLPSLPLTSSGSPMVMGQLRSNNATYSLAAASAGVLVFRVLDNGNWRFYCASPDTATTVQYYNGSSFGTTQVSTYNSTYDIYIVSNGSAIFSFSPSYYVINTDVPAFNSVDAGYEAASNFMYTEPTSIQLGENVNYGSDVLGIPDVTDQDYAPDVITGSLAAPWDETASLADALSHVLDWVNERVRENVDIGSNTIAGDPGASIAIGNDPAAYTAPLGLKDVFPFCLPFDLYNLFACLAADPVAPSFEVPINFAPLNLTYTFEIDLSAFSDVAALLRKLELLGFCVALVLITRQKMIRG